MKPLATLFFVLTILSVKAQVVDSTQFRLKHYKDIRAKNLINDAEYQRLKSRLLGIPFDIRTDPDSTRARTLHDRYHGRITGGAIMISLGTGILLADGVIWALSTPLGPNAIDHSRGPGTFVLCTGIIGGVTAIVGGVVFGLGKRDKFIFCNEYLAISITGKSNQIGLACNF